MSARFSPRPAASTPSPRESLSELRFEHFAPLLAEIAEAPGSVELLVIGLGEKMARLPAPLAHETARRRTSPRSDGDGSGRAHLQCACRRKPPRRRAAAGRAVSLAEAYAHCAEVARDGGSRPLARRPVRAAASASASACADRFRARTFAICARACASRWRANCGSSGGARR